MSALRFSDTISATLTRWRSRCHHRQSARQRALGRCPRRPDGGARSRREGQRDRCRRIDGGRQHLHRRGRHQGIRQAASRAVAARVTARIEDFSKPVVAATPTVWRLGGGLEVALACHERDAGSHCENSACRKSSSVSFPVPAVRSACSRLIGTVAAIELISNGRIVSANEACQLGIIDSLIESSPIDAAVAIARSAADFPCGAHRHAARPDRTLISEAIDKAAAEALRKARGQRARRSCVVLPACSRAYRQCSAVGEESGSAALTAAAVRRVALRAFSAPKCWVLGKQMRRRSNTEMLRWKPGGVGSRRLR